MRNLVEPPPSLHCELCHGELRFKRIEPDDPVIDIVVEIFVCVECGRVHSRSDEFTTPMPHTPRGVCRAVRWISRAEPAAIDTLDARSPIQPISSRT